MCKNLYLWESKSNLRIKQYCLKVSHKQNIHICLHYKSSTIWNAFFERAVWQWQAIILPLFWVIRAFMFCIVNNWSMTVYCLNIPEPGCHCISTLAHTLTCQECKHSKVIKGLGLLCLLMNSELWKSVAFSK